MLREQPAEEGKPPTRTVGRAEKAVYTTKDGTLNSPARRVSKAV
jgi:hypothetical protein